MAPAKDIDPIRSPILVRILPRVCCIVGGLLQWIVVPSRRRGWSRSRLLPVRQSRFFIRLLPLIRTLLLSNRSCGVGLCRTICREEVLRYINIICELRLTDHNFNLAISNSQLFAAGSYACNSRAWRDPNNT